METGDLTKKAKREGFDEQVRLSFLITVITY